LIGVFGTQLFAVRYDELVIQQNKLHCGIGFALKPFWGEEMMDLKDFTAAEARELVKSNRVGLLEEFLVAIKKEAEKGKTVCYYTPSRKNYHFDIPEISDQLRERGFEVEHTDTQRDGRYFTIKWEE